MESPKEFKSVRKEEFLPEVNSVAVNDNAPVTEAGPDTNLVHANAELRNITRDLAAINAIDRVEVFQRMFKGPEMVTDNPALTPFFDKISAIEDRYGRDAIKEISVLYGADRL